MNHIPPPPEKSNAMRLLDSAGLRYRAYRYEVEDGKIDALSIAAKIGELPDQVFKTLVTVAPGPEYFVFVVPGNGTLDLKKAAKCAHVKRIDMLLAKQLLPLTGYIHGGCSPVGMKKLFPTFIDETAVLFDYICVSGGRIGLNLAIAPEDLAGIVNAQFADLLAVPPKPENK